MPSTLLIYNNLPGRSALAARVVIDDSGKTWFVPGEEGFDQVMSMIGGGAFSMVKKQFFKPDDGDAFLGAVEDMFARSSMWSTSRVNPGEQSPDEEVPQ